MAVLLSRVLLLCLPVLCHFTLHCLASQQDNNPPAASRLVTNFLCPQLKREDIKTGAYRFFLCIVCEHDPFCWKHKGTTTSATTVPTTIIVSTTASTTTTTEAKTTTKATTTKPKSETVPAPTEAPEGT